MIYKLTEEGDVVIKIEDNRKTWIPTQEGNRMYREYLEWVAEGNTPEPADPPPPPSPDWRGFLNAMRQTTVFAQLKGQARVDIGANALATQLYADLQGAVLGLADPEMIQESVDELLPSLSTAQIAEIQAGVTAFNIPLTLPAP